MIQDWNEYPNFAADEFRCKGEQCCGGAEEMQEDFIKLLQELRHGVGFPLAVSSGYRCPVYNSSVSTTGTEGPHTTGRAVDILVSGEHAWDVMFDAFRLGFTGLGVSQKGEHSRRFLHLDTLINRRPWIWSY